MTFLFTDIEGSTRAWEANPTEMADALARHDALMSAAIEGSGGYVFRTVGDAFCAVFADPAGGARAAVAAQRALSDERWPGTTVIRVRMALHSGTCVERAGDYYGTTVNRVARLLSLGHGGQTLMSGVTAALLAEALPDGLALRDLGEHRLKDLSRPEHVFQVDADGLAVSFPALRSFGETRRGNLPQSLTPFIGRQDEMEAVAELTGSSRLVTLAGPGGIGKTRIALEAASARCRAWPDGAWLVDLAPVDEPESVAVEVGGILRVWEQSGGSFLDTLTEAVADRQTLVVLDNCEQVIDGVVKVVDALLRSCPHVSILATSREPLGVNGEHVLRVGSMPVPAAEEAEAPERVAASDAVRLFVDRAALHDRGFTLHSANAAAIARVCRRLDGIPLAIELAAARLRTMSLAELEEGLGERFRLLTGGPRGSRERHQALRATVDWSFELLTPDERTLFAYLSVFSGGFDLAAATAVWSGDQADRWSVLHLLTALADKSLVLADNQAAAVRFDLLETMRAYACDRLAEQGAEAVTRVRRAHRDHYLLLAESQAPRLEGAEALDALQQLEVESGKRMSRRLLKFGGDPELAQAT